MDSRLEKPAGDNGFDVELPQEGLVETITARRPTVASHWKNNRSVPRWARQLPDAITGAPQVALGTYVHAVRVRMRPRSTSTSGSSLELKPELTPEPRRKGRLGWG